MSIEKKYLFQSKRLGFRCWQEADLELMVDINSDPTVMEFFPRVLSEKETGDFISRMEKQFTEKGFCYFAVDKLIDGRFIGFIGLSEQTFEADFTPCTDIGWRLSRDEWNQGFASEGARRCLEYAFHELKLKKINSIAPAINLKSENVMLKIGMKKIMNFKHPKLHHDKRLEECILYKIKDTGNLF